MTDDLVLERDGAVAIVRFNRPEASNAFTPEMNQELAELLRNLGSDETARVVILTGTGKTFSAGADLKSLAEPGRLGRPAEVGYERVRDAGLRIEELLDFPKPTIAAVNGAVAGFACSLVFACDVALAAESARFAITFSRIGYVPDAGVSYFLPRLVGLQRAKELFFSGEVIGSAEADRIGLVNRVVPDDELMDRARELARTFASRPATALRVGKRLLNRAAGADFRSVIELEAQAQGILGTTLEHQEAVKAFGRRKEP